MGKTGPKAVVEDPIMDPIVMDAEIQHVVEHVAQATRCFTCTAPLGPGMPHPNCPENQEARKKVKKERQKEARRKKVEKEAERIILVSNDNDMKEARKVPKMKPNVVTRKNIVRDMVLQQSVKAQEQIMSDVLQKIGADKGLKGAFKLELSRTQGGRDLEVGYTMYIRPR